MNNEAMKGKGRVESIKGKAIDIAGNKRDDNVMEDDGDMQMYAGKDRVGFVAVRRNAKKGDKSERY